MVRARRGGAVCLILLQNNRHQGILVNINSVPTSTGRHRDLAHRDICKSQGPAKVPSKHPRIDPSASGGDKLPSSNEPS